MWHYKDSEDSVIHRLNSGNFGIFEPHKLILNLKGSVCRTFKIIKNDTKIVSISWGTKVEIPFLNFCVGETVGVHHGTKFLYNLKDALKDCASFDTSIAIEGWWGIMVSPEKPLKTYTLRGLKLRGFRQNQVSNEFYLYQNVCYKTASKKSVYLSENLRI